MLRVLMVGPARNVKGGMTTVVDSYFEYGLKDKVHLKYIESCNDGNKVSKLIQEIKGLYAFKRNIKKYDIIHIHMASRRSTFRKLKYLTIAQKYSKKVVLHIHGGGFSKFYDEECSAKQKDYIKANLNKADKVIVLSEEWNEYFSKIIKNEKLEIIYNGVKMPERYNKDLSNRNIVFLGRINKQKGIYDLINSIKKVKEKYADVCLYIGGSGEEEKIKKIVNELNLDENVKMLGWINSEQRDEILRKCAIFALPSYFEGMPMTILEAMSYGCVILSTNVGSIPKVIKNNENGIIFEPGDIDTISDRINFLFDNTDERIKLSQNARETVEREYDIMTHVQMIYNLYDEMMVLKDD